MTDEQIRWMTRLEAAEHLRVHPATLDRYVREQKVRRYRVANYDKKRFKMSDLDALLIAETSED